MSDFMKWLYAHYIRPCLDEAPREDYEMWLSLMDNELAPDQREIYQKNREFTAIQAFLLGLKTGQGLPR